MTTQQLLRQQRKQRQKQQRQKQVLRLLQLNRPQDELSRVLALGLTFKVYFD